MNTNERNKRVKKIIKLEEKIKGILSRGTIKNEVLYLSKQAQKQIQTYKKSISYHKSKLDN